MKLKLDENGNAVLQDGKPVYVHDDGKEIPFDAPASMAKITQLNSEAKAHRLAKEEAETKYKPFEGLDPEKAKTAIETMQNLDDKKLIDAGEVEKVKAEAKKAYDEQLATITSERDKITQQFHTATISGEFARSQVIKDKTILPSDIMQAQFGKYFGIDESGKMVAKYEDGNPIYSRVNAGELAGFDEALEQIIDNYPHKDNILKGSGGSGGGAGQGGSGNSGNTPKNYNDCKTDDEKVAFLQSQ